MSETREWAIHTVLADGREFFTEKPGGESSARESYDESVRAMQKKGRTVKVELLSRPVGSWGVVDSAEASA